MKTSICDSVIYSDIVVPVHKAHELLFHRQPHHFCQPLYKKCRSIASSLIKTETSIAGTFITFLNCHCSCVKLKPPRLLQTSLGIHPPSEGALSEGAFL